MTIVVFLLQFLGAAAGVAYLGGFALGMAGGTRSERWLMQGKRVLWVWAALSLFIAVCLTYRIPVEPHPTTRPPSVIR